MFERFLTPPMKEARLVGATWGGGDTTTTTTPHFVMSSRYSALSGRASGAPSWALRAAALVCVPLLAAAPAVAQNIITGQVTDAATGETLPGANVSIVEQPSRGATTDADGNYRIVGLTPGRYTVRVSFLGYTSQERAVTLAGNPVAANFALAEGEITVDDFVVVGYGVATRSTETAASAVLSGEQVRTAPVQSVDAAMQGKVAGVQITSYSGAPGAGLTVRVRGIGSINAGNQPLYIVDGVQVRTGTTVGNTSNALSGLNPADIENIEVLKDAAAVAIYGAQGANGVVVITTRRGREGPTTFEFNTSYGAATQPQRFDLLNSQELVRFGIEAARNRALSLGQTFTNTNAASYLYNNTYYRVSPSGNIIYNADGTPAEFDLAFANELAADPAKLEAYINSLPTVDWQDALFRTGLRRRVDLSAAGGSRAVTYRLSAGYNNEEGQVINSAFERYSLASAFEFAPTRGLKIESNIRLARSQGDNTIADGNFVNSPFFQPARQLPFEPIYTDSTRTTFNQTTISGYNPVILQTQEQRPYRQNQLAASLRGVYQLRPDLIWTTLLGTDFLNLSSRTVRPATILAYGNGSVFESRTDILNMNAFSTLSYVKTFNRMHNVNALVGVEARGENFENVSASGTGLPIGFGTIFPTALPGAPSSSDTRYRSAGAFTQVRYDYDQRYFLSASLRRDGSSRFGANNRYGTFYSVSAAWDMARESFLRGSIFDQLQPRISWGTTGNSNIGNFDALTLFGRGGTYNNLTAIRLTQLGDPNLGWEEARTLNGGLDVSVFGGRVTGSLDVYNKVNENLLLTRPLITDSGVGGITKNLGAVQNRGFEVALSTVNFDRGGFSWTSNFTYALNRDKVTRLLDDTTKAIGTSYTVGESQGYYFLYKYAGVNPADGRSMWYDANGNITYSPRAVADQRIMNTIFPLSSGGFNNRFAFRGFSVETFFQFVYKQASFQQQIGFFLLDPTRAQNLDRRILDRWTTPGQITDIPRAYSVAQEVGSVSNLTSSDRFLEDASYVRLKTLTFGYDVPQAWARRVGLNRVNLYVQGQNVVTWTNFTGLDPEVVSTAAAAYPQPRVWLTGLNVTF